MSRVEPTKAESLIRNQLQEYLGAQKVQFVERDVEDSPDLLFSFCNRLVACEVTQIPPAEIFQFVHKHFGKCPKDKAVGMRVTWPEEPHRWVAQAVGRKRDKVLEYKTSSGAEECWLVVHAPTQESQVFVRGKFPWEQHMLKFGACSVASDFDKILFWEPGTGMQVIYQAGDKVEPVQFDLTNGYPSRSFTLFSGPFATTKKGEPPVTYDYGEVEIIDIIVPPMDPQFVGLRPAGRRWRYTLKIIAHATKAEIIPEIIRTN